MRVLLVVLLAFAAAPTATADVPPGFVSQPELATRVQFVVAHPISVYCADTSEAWEAAVAESGARVDAGGFVLSPGGSDAYLSYITCVPLLAKVRVQPFTWEAFAKSLFTLTHETEHLAGHVDEHETDCAALGVIRQAATRFGVKKQARLTQIAAVASFAHAKLPAPYNGPCV